MATTEALLTAEEYRMLPDQGRPSELVRGKIVPMNVPSPRHGEICTRLILLVGNFVDQNGLGRVISNDAGVITEHHPDTVRGPDVAYYSYTRVSKGPLSPGYLSVMPEIVFEVRSPGDCWRDILAKVSDYLNAGVLRVGGVDPQRETVTLYSPDEPEVTLTSDQSLRFPAILPGFSAPVRKLFE